MNTIGYSTYNAFPLIIWIWWQKIYRCVLAVPIPFLGFTVWSYHTSCYTCSQLPIRMLCSHMLYSPIPEWSSSEKKHQPKNTMTFTLMHGRLAVHTYSCPQVNKLCELSNGDLVMFPRYSKPVPKICYWSKNIELLIETMLCRCGTRAGRN